MKCTLDAHVFCSFVLVALTNHQLRTTFPQKHNTEYSTYLPGPLLPGLVLAIMKLLQYSQYPGGPWGPTDPRGPEGPEVPGTPLSPCRPGMPSPGGPLIPVGENDKTENSANTTHRDVKVDRKLGHIGPYSKSGTF